MELIKRKMEEMKRGEESWKIEREEQKKIIDRREGRVEKGEKEENKKNKVDRKVRKQNSVG